MTAAGSGESPPSLEAVTSWAGRGEAIFLVGVAGVLFFSEGLWITDNPVTLLFGSVGPVAAGAMSAVAGLAVILLAAFYGTYGNLRSYLGTLIVMVSAGDLWFGGGFLVGTILGTVGGVLILVLPPYPKFHNPDVPSLTP